MDDHLPYVYYTLLVHATSSYFIEDVHEGSLSGTAFSVFRQAPMTHSSAMAIVSGTAVGAMRLMMVEP